MDSSKAGEDDARTQILNEIQGFLRSENSIEAITITQFLIKLSKKFPNWKELAINRIQTKTIYYIRHAQSEYNAWKTKNIINLICKYKNTIENYDPKITQKGVSQCQELLKSLNKLKGIEINKVYVSPLSRAIQTFDNIKESVVFQKAQEVVITPLLREALDTAGDIGIPKKQLQQVYPQYNFELVGREKWWSSSIPQSEDRFEQKLEKETSNNLLTRFIMIILLVAFDSPNQVCFVSHSKFYKAFSKSFIGISNAECKQVNGNTVAQMLINYFKTLQQQ